MRYVDKIAFERFIYLLRNILNSRNNSLFRDKEEDAFFIWECTKDFDAEFRLHNFTMVPLIYKPVWVGKWEKPLADVIKINVDAE